MSPERWQQIARLFDEVLEQEPLQRSAFLDEACADDEELRREVASLLAARACVGDFLQQGVFERAARELLALQPTLTTGQQIAHFEILAPLGAGGMGEVYLARDIRLERKVALKLLPARFTLDAARLRRFEREARAASSLNHPNIITVYEVGVERDPDGDRHFIATEFVEGMTLRQRLSSGPLPLPMALDLASGIAAALAAAHASGIVHRDIKPENVMVRPDDLVKVLDFGIAKLTEKNAPLGADNTTPAAQLSTEQGMVIGTPGYMSPEQARGLEVDARTDIFSLGVVLYEMIAGRSPFYGATHADIIAALLEREPSPLKPTVPAAAEPLNHLLRKALAKVPAARYQQITEMQTELQSLSEQLPDLATAVPPTKRRSLKQAAWPFSARLILFLSFVLLVALLAALTFKTYTERSQDRAHWGDLSNWRTAQAFSARNEIGAGLAFSPDGNSVAYSLNSITESNLWVRSINVTNAAQAALRRITSGKWRDRSPVWSPDGQRLAFISERSGPTAIWTISRSGTDTAEVKEIDLTTVALVGWRQEQGRELIYYEAHHNLFALDLSSGQIRPITQFDTTRSLAHDFSLAPDAKQVAYVDRIDNQSFVMLKPLPDGAPVALTPGEMESYRSPSWFPDGSKLVYCVNVADSMQVGLIWLNTKERMQITSSTEDFDVLRVSPNGKTILAVSNRENAGIISCDLQTGIEEEQSPELGLNLLPEISFDGKYLAFKIGAARVRAVESLSVRPLEPAAQPSATASQAFTVLGLDAKWSPNAGTLAFLKFEDRDFHLWKVSLLDQKETLLASNVTPDGYSKLPHNRLYPNYNWSPDGARLVYISRKSGQENLWLVSQDGSENRQLTHNLDPKLNLNSPVWSPAGEELAYLTRTAGQQSVRKVYVLRAGMARQVFQQDRATRIVGWLPQSARILIAVGSPTAPQEAQLFTTSTNRAETTLVASLASAYLPSFRLSSDGRYVAFVARQNGVDNLWLVTVKDWSVRRLTDNRDQTFYYSGLNWHPAANKLYYSRQTNWSLVSVIEKLR